jgi:hypothetical protein
MVVRVTQADPLFRSRITREAQAITDALQGDTGEGEGDEEEAEEP